MISFHYCHSEQPGLPEPIRAKREKANGKLGVAPVPSAVEGKNPCSDCCTYDAGWPKLDFNIRE